MTLPGDMGAKALAREAAACRIGKAQSSKTKRSVRVSICGHT